MNLHQKSCWFLVFGLKETKAAFYIQSSVLKIAKMSKYIKNKLLQLMKSFIISEKRHWTHLFCAKGNIFSVIMVNSATVVPALSSHCTCVQSPLSVFPMTPPSLRHKLQQIKHLLLIEQAIRPFLDLLYYSEAEQKETIHKPTFPTHNTNFGWDLGVHLKKKK